MPVAILIAAALCGCKALEKAMAHDSGLRGVVSADAPVEIVRDGFVSTGGPLPTADGGLLFTDARASRIYRLELTGDIKVHRDGSGKTSGLAYMPRGELIAAEAGAGRISITGRDGAVSELTRGDGKSPLAAVNDLIADARGGVYFTDAGARPAISARKAHLSYLPPDARIARAVDESIAYPQGLALSLDGRTLLVDDGAGPTVYAFDVRADGSLANRRAFAQLRDLKAGQASGAGGMAIDREGRVFVTSATGVQMFDQAGVYLGTIPVPRRATNVAFSGPGKGTLYITAREALYRVRMLTRGPARPGK